MNDIDKKWNVFACTGSVKDYLAYCIIKEGNNIGCCEGKNVKRCAGSKGNERGGERQGSHSAYS